MNSFEWEVFKRTGKIEHFLLLKDVEKNGVEDIAVLQQEDNGEELKEE